MKTNLFTHEYIQIDFLSANFSKAVTRKKAELLELSIPSIEGILSNKKLILSNEDELLSFINELYKKNRQFSILYEYVLFSNVESKTVDEFLSIFDDNDFEKIERRIERNRQIE